VKNRKIISLQPPTKPVAIPNEPAIQSDDKRALNNLFDVCISSDSICSNELRNEYKQFEKDQSNLISLKKRNIHQHIIDFLKKEQVTIKIPIPQHIDNFESFLEFSLSEYYINSLRQKEYKEGDERTYFVECILPYFKLFGNLTKRLSFTW
jgi:hypothetical protein